MKKPLRNIDARAVLTLGILFAVLVFVFHNRPVSASSTSYNGITVTPAIVNVDVKTGQSQVSFDINVTNNTKNSLSLTVSSVDFRSLNDTGGVAFIGNDTSQVVHKYGLASWLDVGSGSIELAPNQSKAVSISVANRSDLSPGGHYAAVLFKATNPSSSSAPNHVTINEVVSTLVFVRKLDGASFGIKLQKPSILTSWVHFPTNIDLFFQNTGNIQEIPRGLVTITSPLSKEVSRGLINTDSSLVLPENTRLFRTSLFTTSHAWWPGRYTVHVMYHYDGSSAVATTNISFIYMNLPALSIAVLLLIALWYLIRKLKRWYRRVKQHRVQKSKVTRLRS